MWAGSWIFTQKKNWRISEIMPSVHAPPSTTAKVMHVSFSSNPADFILIDFWLLDYLWQSLYHLDVTNSFIDVSKFSDNTITSTTHCEAMWAPLSIPILSGVIWFLLPFNFSLNFYALSVLTIRLSLTLLLVGEQDNEKNLVGGPTEENSYTKLNFSHSILSWSFGL